MKKLFILIVTSIVSLSMSAQEIVFCDADGNSIESGSTVTLNEFDAEMGQIELTGVGLKNTTSSNKDVTLNVSVESMTGGEFMCCMGANCHMIDVDKNVDYPLTVEANSNYMFTLTEWTAGYDDDTEDYAYGSCMTKFSTGDQFIYINFVYADPAGINSVEMKNVDCKVYNLAGQQIQKMQKGINIVNGKKYMVK